MLAKNEFCYNQIMYLSHYTRGTSVNPIQFLAQHPTLKGFDGLNWKGYLYYAGIGGCVTSGSMLGLQYMHQQQAKLDKKAGDDDDEGLTNESAGGVAIAGFIMGAIIYPAWMALAK